MNKAFKKILERLEELNTIDCQMETVTCRKWDYGTIVKAVEIVKQEAEQYEECYKYCRDCEAYNKEKHHCPKFCKVIKETVKEIEDNHNGWIPCSEQLPDYGERVLLQDFGGNITLEKCEKKKRIKGFTDGNLWSSANNYLAWQPLPEKYQPKGE